MTVSVKMIIGTDVSDRGKMEDYHDGGMHMASRGRDTHGMFSSTTSRGKP